MEIDYIITIENKGSDALLKKMNTDHISMVQVDGYPILFHLFNLYKTKRHIIITDEKSKILEEYLRLFSPVNHTVLNRSGDFLGKISDSIPYGNRIMIIKPNVILEEDILSDLMEDNYIGWVGDNMRENDFDYIILKDNNYLMDILASPTYNPGVLRGKIDFKLLNVNEGKKILGYEDLVVDSKKVKSRSYNHIEFYEDKVVKKPKNKMARDFIQIEINWYKRLKELEYGKIPNLLGEEPFTLERIYGNDIYRSNIEFGDRRKVLRNIIEALDDIHSLETTKSNLDSIMYCYYEKTFERIRRVKDIIPFSDHQEITVNGKRCKNILFHLDKFKELVRRELSTDEFNLIHGDCTFSNIILEGDKGVKLIDPRGYFGDEFLYGDKYFDFAKLYFSFFGGYDWFNHGLFNLFLGSAGVELIQEETGWEHLEEEFFNLIGIDNRRRVQIIHGIIWLSITVYVWENYNAICGAFYRGIYILSEYME